MVGTGGFVFGGDADDGPGGGADGGGGGDGRDVDGNGQLVKWGGHCGKNNFRDRA